MRELTADLFTTLDGFGYGTRAPAYFGYLGPELERWVRDELAQPQEVLLGRTTYERLGAVREAGSDESSGGLTELPKIVVSRTLDEPLAWSNSRLVRSTDEVRALKGRAGAPLRSMGSLSLVRSLLELGLVDRLRLMVFPQILGATGREPILAGLPDIDLEMVGSRVLDARLVVLEYRPARSASR